MGTCPIIKNQTREKHIPKNVDTIGIAFVCYKDENADRGVTKELIEEITYSEFLEKENDALALTFVPYGATITKSGNEILVKRGIFTQSF